MSRAPGQLTACLKRKSCKLWIRSVGAKLVQFLLPTPSGAHPSPETLVVAKVRTSCRQCLGTTVGAGCLAQSNTLVFLALVSQRPDDAVSQECLSLSFLLTLLELTGL